MVSPVAANSHSGVAVSGAAAVCLDRPCTTAIISHDLTIVFMELDRQSDSREQRQQGWLIASLGGLTTDGRDRAETNRMDRDGVLFRRSRNSVVEEYRQK